MNQITYVLNEFPVRSQTFVSNEILGLLERGFRVSVVSSSRGKISFDRIVPHLVVREMRIGELISGHVRALTRFPQRYLRYLCWTVVSIRHGLPWTLYAPAIVQRTEFEGTTHLHTHFASRAAVLAQALRLLDGAPRSVTTHAADIFGKRPGLRLQLHDAAVATVTEYNRTSLAARGITDVAIVRCGVNVSESRRTVARGPAPASSPRLLSVGRLVPKKGHDDLVRAMVHVREVCASVKCLIVGDGPQRSDLEALIEELNLKGVVTLVGPKEPEQVWRLLSDADAFVLACKVDRQGDADGLPVAFLEAAEVGVPIVGCAVRGVGEFLSEQTGRLASSGDPVDLAVKIIESISHTAESRQRAIAAQRLVREHYSIDGQVEGLLRLIARSRTRAGGR